MRDDAYACLPRGALVVCCYAEALDREGLRVGARMGEGGVVHPILTHG